MRTKAPLKGKRSKKGKKLIPSNERWKGYKLATAFVIFSNRPIRNPAQGDELSYGKGVDFSKWSKKINAMEWLMTDFVKNMGVVCGYIKENKK